LLRGFARLEDFPARLHAEQTEMKREFLRRRILGALLHAEREDADRSTFRGKREMPETAREADPQSVHRRPAGSASAAAFARVS
jgi:hypothetical protein